MSTNAAEAVEIAKGLEEDECWTVDHPLMEADMQEGKGSESQR